MDCEEVKRIIINSFNEEKNSHAFLFSTNNLSRCVCDVIEIIRQVNCLKDGAENCDCNICTTIKQESNPDVISVYPDGKEIKTNQVLEIIHRFSSKPLISTYSSYLIVGADKMNDGSSNKMLKFLEEPEENIVGFYITDKVSGILPTIKSRCELYTLNYEIESLYDILNLTEEEYQSYYMETLNIVSKLNNSPKFLLMTESKNIAKKERVDIERILNLIKRMYIIKYENITLGKYHGDENVQEILDVIMTNDIKTIVKRINLLDNIINEFKINVNKELFMNKLFLCWE